MSVSEPFFRYLQAMFVLPKIVDSTRFARLVDAAVECAGEDAVPVLDKVAREATVTDERVTAAAVALLARLVDCGFDPKDAPTVVGWARDVVGTDADPGLHVAVLQLWTAAPGLVEAECVALAYAVHPSLAVRKGAVLLLGALMKGQQCSVETRAAVCAQPETAIPLIHAAVAHGVTEISDLIAVALQTLAEGEDDRLLAAAALDAIQVVAEQGLVTIDVVAPALTAAAHECHADGTRAALFFAFVRACLALDGPILRQEFDRAVEACASAFAALLDGSMDSAVKGAWRRALTVRMQTAQALRVDDWGSLVEQCILYHDPSGGYASSALPHAALTILAQTQDWSNASARRALMAALDVVAGGGTRVSQASVRLVLDCVRAAQCQPGDVMHVLNALLADKERWERRDNGIALIGILQLAEEDAAARLISLLTDEQVYVRAAAIKALPAHTTNCVEAVMRACADPEALVRRAGCEALSALMQRVDVSAAMAHHKDVMDRLVFDGDWEVKRRFIPVCARAGLAGQLETMLEDSARLVRLEAAQALRDMNVRLQRTDVDLNDWIQLHEQPDTWNTDFEGTGGEGISDLADDELTLDCE